MNGQPVLYAETLSVDYRLQNQWLNVIQNVTLTINPSEIHGLVGESGSGKSTLALALMRYLAANARISSGKILLDGEDLREKSLAQMRQIWGRVMSLVPQDPLAALNPSYTVGNQMVEVIRQHMSLSLRQSWAHCVEMLRRVKIADPELVARRYPHQLSGGMRQRVMIAAALSTQPRLLVLDEPTTALDVTTQAVILDLFRELVHNRTVFESGGGALYVSHDLGTVAQLCDTVTVLYGGEVMESGPVTRIYKTPVHPYTIGLLESLPRPMEGFETRLSTIEGTAPSLAKRPKGCAFAPRCPLAVDQCHAEKPPLETDGDQRMVSCWRWREIAAGQISVSNRMPGLNASTEPGQSHVLKARQITKHFGTASLFERLTFKAHAPVHAVDDVSLKINTRSTLGLVGESGSGKSTLARCIVALETASSGEIELCGVEIDRELKKRGKDTLRNLRMVFQNPNDALNPNKTVGQSIARTLYVMGGFRTRQEVNARIVQLLESVRLTADYADRYPAELSGGEKQRVAIARAFAAEPALIIADEPTSSLDVSVQAVVLNLLKDLRALKGVSYLLISHDLDVISYLADWIAVMYLGQIVEEGSARHVYNAPSHPYTEALISANPLPDPTASRNVIRLDGEVPSARNIPAGCRFHTRCPRKIGDICERIAPPWQNAGDGHRIRCHIPVDELRQLQSSGDAHVAETPQVRQETH